MELNLHRYRYALHSCVVAVLILLLSHISEYIADTHAPVRSHCILEHRALVLEVLEVDILWPRWVARIGVTRSTQACFLAADRQCTELPLLRLRRLPEVVGRVSPTSPRT